MLRAYKIVMYSCGDAFMVHLKAVIKFEKSTLIINCKPHLTIKSVKFTGYGISARIHCMKIESIRFWLWWMILVRFSAVNVLIFLHMCCPHRNLTGCRVFGIRMRTAALYLE